MSGIYISGMEMPKSCGTCPIRHMVFHVGDECYLGAKITGYQQRPEDCPLVPVPEHGPLKDAWRLLDDMMEKSKLGDYKGHDGEYGMSLHDMGQMLINSPTIIPAEEGKG